MEKTIWLVTHAETILHSPEPYGEWVPDPIMSKNACTVVHNLRAILNEKLRGVPAEVHCGTGSRQWQVALTLGFNDPEKVFFSSLWGEAATLAKHDGKRWVLLSNGLLIPYDCYLGAKHFGGKVISGVIASLPHNSVICSGRPVLIRLGMQPEECHSGALYSLCPQENGEISIKLVQEGKILQSRTPQH